MGIRGMRWVRGVYEVGMRGTRWVRGVQGGYEGYEVGTKGMRLVQRV